MKRLAEDTAAPAGVRAMIAAARADAPGPAALERILARVEAAPPPPRGGLPRRLVLVGGAAVAIAIGVVLLRSNHRDGDRRAPDPTPPPVQQPAPVVSALPDDAAPSPAPPVAPPARSAPARTHHAAPSPPPSPPSEVALVEEARAALAGRDFRGALAAAARHQKLYPAGVLGEEREAIRVEALAGTGDRAAARDRLRAFLLRFPRSSYRRHLEEVVPQP
jgi:hypothetical protein